MERNKKILILALLLIGIPLFIGTALIRQNVRQNAQVSSPPDSQVPFNNENTTAQLPIPKDCFFDVTDASCTNNVCDLVLKCPNKEPIQTFHCTLGSDSVPDKKSCPQDYSCKGPGPDGEGICLPNSILNSN